MLRKPLATFSVFHEEVSPPVPAAMEDANVWHLQEPAAVGGVSQVSAAGQLRFTSSIRRHTKEDGEKGTQRHTHPTTDELPAADAAQ